MVTATSNLVELASDAFHMFSVIFFETLYLFLLCLGVIDPVVAVDDRLL